MRRLSSGMAALVGMERVDFLLELHRYGVVAIDMGADELLADLRNA